MRKFAQWTRRGMRAVGMLAVALALMSTSAARAENLLPDPSFETAQQANRYGQVFPQWGGTIYEAPAKFIASPVAHGGKQSCEMQADSRSKIRIYTKEIKPQPGRYQVKFFMRGLDIGEGIYRQTVDFSVGFDNKFFPLGKKGTFGWTPVSYVFDYKSDKPIRVFAGLEGGGRLWVDDFSLEPVADSVALTPAPVLGHEETPIALPHPITGQTVHCPDCQYLNSADSKQCYACGAQLPHEVNTDSGPTTLLLATFADGKIAPFINGKYTTENVPTGKAGILIEKNIQIVTPQDWSKYDYFRFDTFNASDVPVTIALEISDKQTQNYWTRVNMTTVAPPGKSTITFPTNLYVGEKSRPGRMLVRDQITRVVLSVNNTPVVASNFRLDRSTSASVKFGGLYALSFGPFNAPLMEGFARIPTNLDYTPERGMGWEKPQFWRAENVLQPDTLTQSFLTVEGGKFRIDVPNGKYHVLMNIDSPGGFWGEVQTYSNRQVTANGNLVVNDSMTMDSFIKRFYRNAHHEDLPGVDTFTEYVQKMFDVKSFDVDVADGKLEIGFKGQTWANSLSYMIIYPQSQAEKGKAFTQWATDQRKAQFNDYFKQIEPKHAAQPASDYVVFTRPLGAAVNAYDGAGKNDAIGEEGLALTLAKQEISPINFAVQPSPLDLGVIDLKISSFVNDKGAALDPASFTPGWIDYRVTRVVADGSIYTVAPRYWHPTPAPSAPNVTRRFWIRVQVPATTAAGTYKGTITIHPEHGKAKAIPVTLTVLPFELDAVSDVAAGPFGSSIGMPWPSSDPKANQWNWDLFSKSLDVLRDGGFTSFTGVPSISVTAAGGKITLDTRHADKQMDLIRSKGFHMMLASYGAPSLGYNMYGTAQGPDVATAQKAGFGNMHDFLAALYGAIDHHAQEHNWLPIAWNLCDEPLGDAVAPSAANARAHREILGGLKLTTFTGATSMTGNDPANPHMALIQALPIPALNGHDEASLEVVKAAGDKFSFYNGGSRWAYGRYMKMLVLKHDMVLRPSWHFNACAGDPYYALDCREDDYCWFNTDENQAMVPSVHYLADLIPGLNDYRYLSTLQRLLKEKPDHPAAASAHKLFDELMSIRPGIDRNPKPESGSVDQMYQKDRAAVASAIVGLLK